MSIPPEIVDHIIDLTDNHRALQACSLVAKSWVGRSRVHLFRDVVLFSNRRWQEVMPVGETTPAMYTRTLTMGQSGTPQGKWINTDTLYPFLSHLRDFRNVENLILDGWEPHGFSEGGLKKYFGHFGGRLRSLELGGQKMSPESFIILLGLFPNLEDLLVKERVEGSEVTRVPQVLPKLSGCLTIRVHTTSLFPALCRFTLRFQAIWLQEHQHDYQQLINACAETLVDFRAMSLDYGKLSSDASSCLFNPSQSIWYARSPSGGAKRSERLHLPRTRWPTPTTISPASCRALPPNTFSESPSDS